MKQFSFDFSLPQRILPMACKANCNCYLTNLVGIDPKCTRFDMTDLYRVTITDDMTPKEKALFQAYNDNCEAVEDLWIELDFQLWEQMAKEERKPKKAKRKSRVRKSSLFDDCPNEIMEDLKEEFDF